MADLIIWLLIISGIGYVADTLWKEYREKHPKKMKTIPGICAWCGKPAKRAIKSVRVGMTINLLVCEKQECFDAVYWGKLNY